MSAIVLVSVKCRRSHGHTLDVVANLFPIEYPEAVVREWVFKSRHSMSVLEMEVVEGKAEVDGSLESTVESVLVMFQCGLAGVLVYVEYWRRVGIVNVNVGVWKLGSVSDPFDDPDQSLRLAYCNDSWEAADMVEDHLADLIWKPWEDSEGRLVFVWEDYDGGLPGKRHCGGVFQTARMLAPVV